MQIWILQLVCIIILLMLIYTPMQTSKENLYGFVPHASWLAPNHIRSEASHDAVVFNQSGHRPAYWGKYQ